MIISEQKPFEEILRSLGDEKNVFLVGCNGCAEACQTGGKEQLIEMEGKLAEAGKTVTGKVSVDFLCDKGLVKVKLSRHAEKIAQSDSLLVMTCGIGVQATAAVVEKVTHPGCNTISVGGAVGEWPGSERCKQCGDCLLDYTGGLCPLTVCTKGLINGPCGGAKDGKCEFEPEVRDCGWQLIYERLKSIGRLDKMKEILPAKAHSKSTPPPELRGTIRWAIEQKEAVER